MADLVASMTDDLVREIGPKVREAVESSTRQRILASSAKETLTFIGDTGRRYAPEASADYVKALWCFMRGKELDGYISLDSALTGPITKEVEEAIVGQLNSEAVRKIIVRSVVKSAEVNPSVHSVIGDEATLVAREVGNVIGMASGSALADQIANSASGSAGDILSTTAGKSVVAGIVQVAGSTTGKMLIGKLITASTAKVAGTTLLKVGVASSLKKIGLAILIKTVIMKVLALLLPGVVAAKIPVFWILLPIIAAFIYHEMSSMPKKLADKLPSPVGAEVESNFRQIARSFAEMVLADAVVEIARASRMQRP